MEIAALHDRLWANLLARRERLPHALLLCGQRGQGKFELARAFTAGLLCEAPRADGLPCGQCLACGWQAQGNHPDFRLLQPEALGNDGDAGEGGDGKSDGKKKASQQITIDQVRSLDDFLSVGTHRAGLRIVLIHPAEAMNRNTANSLLKSLEEPAPETLFLLVSDEPMRLLPTIRSRCQVVPVTLPDKTRSLALLREHGIDDPERWLALAGGAPLLAQELADSGQRKLVDELLRYLDQGGKVDPLAAAAGVDKVLKEAKGRSALRQAVEWMQKWLVDLTLVRNGMPTRYYLRHEATIAAMVAGVAEARLVRFYRRLLDSRREAEQPLNSRLFLEEFFLNYRALFAD